MRQLITATVGGLIGVALTPPIVAALAGGSSTISSGVLTAVALLPIFGVTLGALLAHRAAPEQVPWPVAEFAHRVPFMVVGALLGALAAYLAYAEMAAVWFSLDFMTLVLDPAQLPTLGSTGSSGRSIENPVWIHMLGYTVAGGWVTGEAIKSNWTG